MNPKCPSCGKVISEGDEVFFLCYPGKVLNFKAPFSDNEKGTFTPFFSRTLDKNIDVLVIPDNYQYGREEDDVCIIVCSEECNQKTKSAIEYDINNPQL